MLTIFDSIRKEFSVNDKGITYTSKRGLSRLCSVRHSSWGQNGYVFNKELDAFIIEELSLDCSGSLSKEELTKLLIEKRYLIIESQKHLIEKRLAMVIIDYCQKKEGVVLKTKPKVQPQGYIYLIKNKNTGNVKIGYSTNPCKRLETLQTATDCELELLTFKKGTIQQEKTLHQKFNVYLIRNEWFKFSPSIASEFSLYDLLLKIDTALKNT